MIGYRAGISPLHRAHPYTPLAIAVTMLCLVFAANRPVEVGVVVLAAAAFSLVGGVLGYTTRPALLLALPTWALLLVLHGILGTEPYRIVGSVALSWRFRGEGVLTP